jgi:hypothetical protein
LRHTQFTTCATIQLPWDDPFERFPHITHGRSPSHFNQGTRNMLSGESVSSFSRHQGPHALAWVLIWAGPGGGLTTRPRPPERTSTLRNGRHFHLRDRRKTSGMLYRQNPSIFLYFLCEHVLACTMHLVAMCEELRPGDWCEEGVVTRANGPRFTASSKASSAPAG